MKKRLTAYCLCIFAAVFITACGADNLDEKAAVQTTADYQEGQIPVADSRELEMNQASMMGMQLRQDTAYYYTYEKDEETDLYSLVCCRQEGEDEAEILCSYGDDVLMKASRVDGQGNWYNLYEQKKADKSLLFLEKLDSQGSSQFLQPIEDFEDILRQDMVLDSAVSQEGEFHVLTESGTLLFWNGQGREVKRIDNAMGGDEAVRWEEGLVDAGSSGIYIYLCEEDKVTFRRVDSASRKLDAKREIKIPSNHRPGEHVFSDSSAWVKVYSSYEDIIYLVGRDKLWGYSPADNELTELLEWSAPYVNLQPDFIEQITMMDDNLVLLCYDVFQNVSSRVVIGHRTGTEAPQKQTIILGAINDRVLQDNLTSLIRKYNAQSKEYMIELKFYGEAGGSRSEAITQMNIDLLQGKGPDLFNLSNHSIPELVEKGVLEDLFPYLESSENIKKEDLVQGVVKAMEVDGGLYSMTSSFSVAAQVSLCGYSADGGMSTEQYMQLVQDYPDAAPLAGASRYGLLDLLISADMDRYMNRREKTCAFDSGEFIHLLKTVSGWKESDIVTGDPQRAQYLHEKQVLMVDVSFSDMIQYLQIISAFGDFGCISGQPNKEGKPKYPFYALDIFGIGSGSRQKEGAWDFIEYLISDEHQDSVTGFPVRVKSFEKALEVGMEATGSYLNPYSGERENGIRPTKEDQEAVKEIVQNMYYESSGVINTILWEETAPVFSGDKEAEEAAKVIQGRAFLYLNE